MVSQNRFLLSLVAALFLSVLASADSTNVSLALLHSGTSAPGANSYDRVNNLPGHFSSSAVKNASANFVAYNSHIRSSEGASFQGSPLLPRQAMFGSGAADHNSAPMAFQDGKRMTSRYRADSIVWNRGKTLSTPEPGSLMLLSTGLMGIAGMLRRKLRLG